MGRVLRTEFTEADARLKVGGPSLATSPETNGEGPVEREEVKESRWKRMLRSWRDGWMDFKRGWRSPKNVAVLKQNWGWFLRHHGVHVRQNSAHLVYQSGLGASDSKLHQSETATQLILLQVETARDSNRIASGLLGGLIYNYQSKLHRLRFEMQTYQDSEYDSSSLPMKSRTSLLASHLSPSMG
jgi:hypothetical protein